jgi:hypothetical protein
MKELSTEDKELLAEAHMQYNIANAILQFLGTHFQKKYKLQYGETITPEGKIESPQVNGEVSDSQSLSKQKVEN